MEDVDYMEYNKQELNQTSYNVVLEIKQIYRMDELLTQILKDLIDIIYL